MGAYRKRQSPRIFKWSKWRYRYYAAVLSRIKDVGFAVPKIFIEDCLPDLNISHYRNAKLIIEAYLIVMAGMRDDPMRAYHEVREANWTADDEKRFQGAPRLRGPKKKSTAPDK